MLRLFWTLRRPPNVSRGRMLAGLALTVVVIGVIAVALVIGGAAGLAWTNTEQFCTGCHEMRENVYAEFKGTIHDVNRSGVRAICSNCHVPHEPWPLIKRKMRASLELWGHFMGAIDTKEKFEKRRYELATR